MFAIRYFASGFAASFFAFFEKMVAARFAAFFVALFEEVVAARRSAHGAVSATFAARIFLRFFFDASPATGTFLFARAFLFTFTLFLLTPALRFMVFVHGLFTHVCLGVMAVIICRVSYPR